MSFNIDVGVSFFEGIVAFCDRYSWWAVVNVVMNLRVQ
jgi:hypothetical protein